MACFQIVGSSSWNKWRMELVVPLCCVTLKSVLLRRKFSASQQPGVDFVEIAVLGQATFFSETMCWKFLKLHNHTWKHNKNVDDMAALV
jgi:hypothetical protein